MKKKPAVKKGTINLLILDLIKYSRFLIGLSPNTAPDRKKNNGI